MNISRTEINIKFFTPSFVTFSDFILAPNQPS